MKDALLQVTRTIAAAGASNSSTGIDIGARGTPNGITPPYAEGEVIIPTVTGLANAATLTVTVEDSDDDSTYASVGRSLPAYVLTGAGGVGATGYTAKFRLPPSAKRYVRISTAVSAAGGTLTSLSVTFSILIP